MAVSAPLDGKFLHQYQPRECDIAVANRPSNKPVSLRERKEPWNIGRGVSLGIFESFFGFLFACFGFSMCFTCFFCMFPFILKHFREAKIQQKQEKQKKYPPKEKEFKKNTPSIGTSEHAGPCKLHVPLIASLKIGFDEKTLSPNTSKTPFPPFWGHLPPKPSGWRLGIVWVFLIHKFWPTTGGGKKSTTYFANLAFLVKSLTKCGKIPLRNYQFWDVTRHGAKPD